LNYFDRINGINGINGIKQGDFLEEFLASLEFTRACAQTIASSRQFDIVNQPFA
jgi:hypothetical protein